MTTRFADHLLTGIHSARPAASAVPAGTLYACSTHGLVYQSDGSSAWSTWATLGAGGGVAADTIWDTKGDLAAATGADAASKLAVGSNGQILTADSTQATGIKWAAATGGGMAADTLWDTKGDLAVASAADTAAKLAVGSNGEVLTADSAQTLGVKWAAAGGGAVIGALVPKLRTGSTANRYYIAGAVNAAGTSSGSSTPNHIRVLPFISSQAITADRIGIASTSGASGNMRLGIYADDGNLYPGSLLVDSGNVSINATGMLTATISQALSAGTVYWLAYLPSADPFPRTVSINALTPILGHDPASAAFPCVGWDLTVTYGALPNPFTAGAAVINAAPIEAIYLRAA